MRYRIVRAIYMCCVVVVLAGCADLTKRGDAQYKDRDYAEALQSYKAEAEKGNSHAQLQLGHMYALGLGVQADAAQAAVWDQAADAQDPKDAELALGDIDAWIEHKPADAEAHYQKAAALGDRVAYVMLAFLYENGLGVERNDSTAQGWLHRYGDYDGPASEEFYKSTNLLLSKTAFYSSVEMMQRDRGWITVRFHYTGGPATDIQVLNSQGSLELDVSAILSTVKAKLPVPPSQILNKGITNYQFDLVVTP